MRRIKAPDSKSVKYLMMAKSAYPPTKPDDQRLALVDDDHSLLEALMFSFETQGFQVSGFSDAETALSDRPDNYSCFIVDQNLPGMSGLDLIERLRAKGVSAPAILITTQPSRNMRSRARLAQVEIVEKPLLGDLLGNEVRRLMLTAP